MKKFYMYFVLAAVTLLAAGCQRIETGEVGLRRGFDKQIQKTELLPGSFNQEIVGEVIVFPVKQIALQLENMTPQTLDHSTLKDLDITVIYNINPSSVAELYTTESQGFHSRNDRGETVLMYNYLQTVANSAAYKSINKYEALEVSSKRDLVEADILKFMTSALEDKKLVGAITIVQVQVKSILPAQSITDSANNVITAQNNKNAKSVEVEIAKLEAQRLSALSQNTNNIEYMKAKALQDIGEGVKSGAVKAVVVPWDFKGLLQVGM